MPPFHPGMIPNNGMGDIQIKTEPVDNYRCVVKNVVSHCFLIIISIAVLFQNIYKVLHLCAKVKPLLVICDQVAFACNLYSLSYLIECKTITSKFRKIETLSVQDMR